MSHLYVKHVLVVKIMISCRPILENNIPSWYCGCGGLLAQGYDIHLGLLCLLTSNTMYCTEYSHIEYHGVLRLFRDRVIIRVAKTKTIRVKITKDVKKNKERIKKYI